MAVGAAHDGSVDDGGDITKSPREEGRFILPSSSSLSVSNDAWYAFSETLYLPSLLVKPVNADGFSFESSTALKNYVVAPWAVVSFSFVNFLIHNKKIYYVYLISTTGNY